MKTAVFKDQARVSEWFDKYLDAVNFCLRKSLLLEIKEDSYVLAENYCFRFLNTDQN